jgi:hypothetical protein
VTHAEGVVDLLADRAERRLGENAEVGLLAPSGEWRVVRLQIIPHNPRSARMLIWDDGGDLVITAGEAARFDVSLDAESETLNQAEAIMWGIAVEGLTERLVGSVSLSARIGVHAAATIPFVRVVTWCPYRAE